MGLKFRLKGLAETFLEHITCPSCGMDGNDEEKFSTELTRVTMEGIVVVVQCRMCTEIFVPTMQRLGVLNIKELKKAVTKDSYESGEPLLGGIEAVRLNVERLNAMRRGDVH